MQEFEIIFYDKVDGSEPAKDFILSLETKMRAKVFRTIDMLRKNGNKLREPESSGFIKKTQKTTKSEIELAKRYRSEYLNRKEKKDD